MKIKECPICHVEYNIDEGFWKSSKGYYNPYCKSCTVIKARIWYNNTKSKRSKVRQRSK